MAAAYILLGIGIAFSIPGIMDFYFKNGFVYKLILASSQSTYLQGYHTNDEHSETTVQNFFYHNGSVQL